MHVLMLGWEFPPFITGGLGTACHGLTRAMNARGTRVTFVLPRAVASDAAAHVDLLGPDEDADAEGDGADGAATKPRRSKRTSSRIIGPAADTGAPTTPGDVPAPGTTRILPIAAGFSHPYPQSGSGPVGAWVDGPTGPGIAGGLPGAPGVSGAQGSSEIPGMPWTSGAAPGTLHSGGHMIDQAAEYARFCVEATDGMSFDVIHAHDWMTYPAGLWIAGHSGKPLVVHIHSTEFDRSGEHVNQRIYDIERRGMHGAMRVIAVSQLTKNIVVNRYAVPDRHVEVVYNGVELEDGYEMPSIRSRDKIVLYFGRITYQKGPEYFVRAAKRVLEVMDNVKFVVAGSGDGARQMIELAAEMGIGHKVLFTGFLRGQYIKKVFGLADLYVMPSVSEPFGIAPLEAMGHDVPVLISRSSGVSEVLTHALKVDFWDVDDMANKIVAVLRHSPLGETLRRHGRMEVRSLTWDGAAERCERVYRDVTGEMTHPVMSVVH